MISVQHCFQTDEKNRLDEFCDGNQLKNYDDLLMGQKFKPSIDWMVCDQLLELLKVLL